MLIRKTSLKFYFFKWFPYSKAFANSVLLIGLGLGTVVFEQVQTLYINPENISPDKPYSDEFPDEKYKMVIWQFLKLVH